MNPGRPGATNGDRFGSRSKGGPMSRSAQETGTPRDDNTLTGRRIVRLRRQGILPRREPCGHGRAARARVDRRPLHDEEGVIARASGGSPGSSSKTRDSRSNRRIGAHCALGGRARDAGHRSDRGGRPPCRWIGGSRRARCGRCGPHARAGGTRSRPRPSSGSRESNEERCWSAPTWMPKQSREQGTC